LRVERQKNSEKTSILALRRFFAVQSSIRDPQYAISSVSSLFRGLPARAGIVLVESPQQGKLMEAADNGRQ
jgi:hypothetical protein